MSANLIKNIPFSEVLDIQQLVDYRDGQVVSRTLAQNPTLSLTLFAFEAGEEISSHTAPGDAFIQVLDGTATVTIDKTEYSVGAGQVIVMPANIPHAVRADARFKMLLVVVKPQKL